MHCVNAHHPYEKNSHSFLNEDQALLAKRHFNERYGRVIDSIQENPSISLREREKITGISRSALSRMIVDIKRFLRIQEKPKQQRKLKAINFIDCSPQYFSNGTSPTTLTPLPPILPLKTILDLSVLSPSTALMESSSFIEDEKVCKDAADLLLQSPFLLSIMQDHQFLSDLDESSAPYQKLLE